MTADGPTASPPHVGYGDLTARLAAAYREERRVAWDVETTGLDWRRDRLATCQIYAPEVGASVISMTNAEPTRLLHLLEDSSVEKVFHHAPFDLRFMAHNWGAVPTSIRCTKVASKLLRPTAPNDVHTLQQLTWRHLGVRLEKDAVRTSDWTVRNLSTEQVAYATRDVLYLLPLLDALEEALDATGIHDLYDHCCAFLPTQTRLAIGSYPDVFAY
jgi:ribonuclease D